MTKNIADIETVSAYLDRHWFTDKKELRLAREYIKKNYQSEDCSSLNLRYYSTANMPKNIENNCITFNDLVNFTLMRSSVKVYIASPYTKGDVAVNVRRQIDAVDALINMGFLPFAPLYYHFQHLVHPRPYDDWLHLDISWMLQCDCILRLEGESSGADEEVKVATENNIPVFYSYTDIHNFYNNK